MKYDVFISSKSEDYVNAQVVCDFLKSKGVSVFLASESLKKAGNAEYLKEIDSALELCKHFILFTTRREYAESKFVMDEWQIFRNEKLSGRKDGNLLSILGNGMTIGDLPVGLRKYQVIKLEDFRDTLMDYLPNCCSNEQEDRRNSDSSKAEQHSNEINILIEASLNGDAKSQYVLGYCYCVGDGVKQSYEEAAKWFRLAADQGNDGAQYNLGILYHKGDGVIQSYDDAAKWYRLAADQGNVHAQHLLGNLFHDGKGVEKSCKEAAKWYHLAAKQGDAFAQFHLGGLYLCGEGVEQSYEEAADWFRKSAEQGYHNAQYALGCLYYEGKGVEKSNKEATKWWRIAADQGNAEAQNRIGSH